MRILNFVVYFSAEIEMIMWFFSFYFVNMVYYFDQFFVLNCPFNLRVNPT